MSLKDLLAKNASRVPKKKESNEDRLVFIDMSKKGYVNKGGTEILGHRGTIRFIPVMDLNNDPVKYLYNVWNYARDKYDEENDRTYRVTTRVCETEDYIAKLSDEQKAKNIEVRSLINTYAEWGPEFWEAQNKSYALIFGYVLDHVTTDNKVVSDINSRKSALIIIPSKNFAKAFQTCLKNMESYGEMGDEMYENLFSRKEERDSFLEMTFDASEGFGYDVTLNAKSFDRYQRSIMTADELKEGIVRIPQDKLDQCTYLSSLFLYGTNDSWDFPEEYIDAAIEDLKVALNKLNADASSAEDLDDVPENPNEKKDNWESEEPADDAPAPKRGRRKAE